MQANLLQFHHIHENFSKFPELFALTEEVMTDRQTEKLGEYNKRIFPLSMPKHQKRVS